MSNDRLPNSAERIETALAGFHTVLSNVYETVKQENLKQKSMLSQLTNKLYSVSDVRKQNQNTEGSNSECELNHVLPELEESDILLKHCKEIKKHFHKNHFTVFKQNKNQKFSLCNAKEDVKVKYQLTDTLVRNSAKCSVITEREMQQLSELLREETVPGHIGFPSCDYNSSKSNSENTEGSHLQLMEKNKMLYANISLYLDKKPSENSLLFLQKIESSLCHDCDMLIQEKDTNEKGQSKVDGEVTELFYQNRGDVITMCKLLSELQFIEFHHLVQKYVQSNIIPVLEDQPSLNGISVSLQQKLLKLGIANDEIGPRN